MEWFTGFDHYATADMTTGPTPRFTSMLNVTITTGSKRNGINGATFAVGATAYLKKLALSNMATRWLGFAHNNSNITADADRVIAVLCDGDPGTAGNVQVGIAVNSSGQITCWRGRALGQAASGTQLGSASALALVSSTWQFIELGATIDASAGTVQVYVDNVNWVTLTAQNTRSTANSYANGIGINGRNTGVMFIDDMYTHSTRKGIGRATSIHPSLGDGAVNNFSLSAGADRGALVDEIAPDGVATYLESAAANDIQTLAFPTVGSGLGTIHAVQVHLNLSKNDAGSCEATPVVRVGGVNYPGISVPISQTYGFLTEVWAQNPGTAALWTPTGIDGAEFGGKHTV